ncbi:MAG: hypothetical protein H7Z19_02785 [Chitinophagaceae bacterium]|nr:hypothetical protein [Rubrivivax sp.]
MNTDGGISAKLSEQFDASGSAAVNMAKLGPSTWTKFCVLGPYTTNDTAEIILGFKWDVEHRSSIGTNDGINLLVFVKDQEVLAHAEHRRDKGDFLKLQPRCLARAKATLVRQANPGGWVQLVAE